MSTVSLAWENVDDPMQTAGTYRAKVFGGWLIKTIDHVQVSLHEDMRPQEGYEWRTALCFVPDEHHLWGVLK